MEPFEVHGLWWLPAHEEHQVPGVLSWDPARGGTLRLVGQLWPVVLLDNELPSGQVQKYRDHTHDADGSRNNATTKARIGRPITSDPVATLCHSLAAPDDPASAPHYVRAHDFNVAGGDHFGEELASCC